MHVCEYMSCIYVLYLLDGLQLSLFFLSFIFFFLFSILIILIKILNQFGQSPEFALRDVLASAQIPKILPLLFEGKLKKKKSQIVKQEHRRQHMVTVVIKPGREGQGERMKTSGASFSLFVPLKCSMLIGSWIIAKNGFLLIAFHFSVCLFLPAAQQEQAFKSQRHAFVEWRWRMGEWSINARRRC